MLVLPVFLLGGCYHAVVNTGLTASPTVQENLWAMSFIYGLVPPAPVDSHSKCPRGVSKVETQMSFLNGLVNAVTFGIVTPMTITVTCAQ